jgi:hypothetical protein
VDSGQLEVINTVISGGIAPYTVDFFNVTGNKPGQIIGYNGFIVAGNYPLPTYDGDSTNGCNVFGNNIICMGGRVSTWPSPNDISLNSVYYAPILSDGLLGPWTASNTYPGVPGPNSYGSIFACFPYSNTITSTNNIYCFGQTSNQINYAPVLPGGSGVGAWATSANVYPSNSMSTVGYALAYQGCATYANDVYCLTGIMASPTGNYYYTNAAYYAPIFSSGETGPWTAVTSYPTNDANPYCLTYSNDIYCMGGYGFGANGGYSPNYYAAIISPGVLGAWQPANSATLPVSSHISCLTNSNTIYCIPWSGSNLNYPFYYAPIFSSGVIGTWQIASKAGNLVDSNGNDYGACVSYSNSIYCFTDWNSINAGSQYNESNNIAFAPISQFGGIANTPSWGFLANSPTNGNVFHS